ncbi:MAG: hypothetical protein U1E21_02490 [Reyranellaceae bacterium]
MQAAVRRPVLWRCPIVRACTDARGIEIVGSPIEIPKASVARRLLAGCRMERAIAAKLAGYCHPR